MERSVYSKLLEWKNNPGRKPLILNGARQVGKTWLLKEFGNKEYGNTAYINCDETPEMKDLFTDYDTSRLIRAFSALSNTVISPSETLIILDEAQEAPLCLTALKYFCEKAPEYHIAVAGSLLGISLHEGSGFPVGKVDEIKLYPFSFEEFILALGKDTLHTQLKERHFDELSRYSKTFTELLRQYYYVGGMPAVIREYIQSGDLQEVRHTQKQILSDYRKDFSRHIPANTIARVNMVWDSIPGQLAKENKKFIYGAVSKGGRAKDYEHAIQWLIDAGLLHKVKRVRKIEKPLKFYEDDSAFKLFAIDLGLLGAMSEVSAKDILVKNTAFTEYKGAFTEQFILQEMVSAGMKAYYYSKENSTLEIDFVIQKEDLYPIEVKAEENLRSKSLRTIYANTPGLNPCRFSMSDYREQDWMVNVPLYLAKEWLLAQSS